MPHIYTCVGLRHVHIKIHICTCIHPHTEEHMNIYTYTTRNGELVVNARCERHVSIAAFSSRSTCVKLTYTHMYIYTREEHIHMYTNMIPNVEPMVNARLATDMKAWQHSHVDTHV